MDLFDLTKGILPDLNYLIETAKSAIADIFLKGHPCVVAYSGGKTRGFALH